MTAPRLSVVAKPRLSVVAKPRLSVVAKPRLSVVAKPRLSVGGERGCGSWEGSGDQGVGPVGRGDQGGAGGVPRVLRRQEPHSK